MYECKLTYSSELSVERDREEGNKTGRKEEEEAEEEEEEGEAKEEEEEEKTGLLK